MRLICGFLMAATALVAAGQARALEPAYVGQFGYAEEPALRPYKWLWVGLKSFGYQTQDSFVRGNMNTPVLGSVEVFRGIRRGSFALGENTVNGLLYREVPPKGFYKFPGDLNNYVERDMLLRNAADFATIAVVWKWYAWPLQKVVDHYPLEDDEKVQIRLDRARLIRQDRREAAEARNPLPDESRVLRSQRNYIGQRAEYGTTRKNRFDGNLLRLAR
jgi:hypothetical protein